MSGAGQLLRELDAISGSIRAAAGIEELEPLIRAQESTVRQIVAADPRELGPAAASSLQNALLAAAEARNTLLAERGRAVLEWREVAQLQSALTSLRQSRTDEGSFSVQL